MRSTWGRTSLPHFVLTIPVLSALDTCRAASHFSRPRSAGRTSRIAKKLRTRHGLVRRLRARSDLQDRIRSGAAAPASLQHLYGMLRWKCGVRCAWSSKGEERDMADNITYGTNGNDILSGGNGKDTIYGLDGDDIISGGNGVDRLFGDGGNDTLYGDNGDDHLTGGADDDLLDGKNGFDTAYYSGSIGEYTFFSRGRLSAHPPSRRRRADGHDRVIRVERLVFADRVIDIGSGNNAPVAVDDHVFIDEDTGTYQQRRGERDGQRFRFRRRRADRHRRHLHRHLRHADAQRRRHLQLHAVRLGAGARPGRRTSRTASTTPSPTTTAATPARSSSTSPASTTPRPPIPMRPRPARTRSS